MRTTLTTALPAALLIALLVIAGCSKMEDEQMVLVPVEDDPTVSFRIQIMAGSQQDPPGKEGLAYMTAQMLTEGATMNNSYDGVLELLYPLASGYFANVDKETTTIIGRTHTDNIEAYYALFTDAILRPGFAQEDFDRLKSNTLNYIEKTLRYSSDEELGKHALYGLVFEGTPYAHLTMGTVESLNAMTLDDVKDFYNKYYSKDNIVIGLGGGFNSELPDALLRDVQSLLEGEVTPPDAPKPAPIEGHQVLIVEKDADATAISFGFPIDVLRGDEDFFALALFNSWFGEHRNSSSHLYQVIREVRGMNYGDYSYIEIFPNGGQLSMPEPNHARRQQLFEVWIRPVPNEQRHFALRAAVRELQLVIENGLTQEQFELTQKFLDTYALNWANTTSKRLGYALDSRFYGIDKDYVESFRRKINALTLEQVNAAIKKHLRFENIAFAIVTKGGEEFKQQLVEELPSPISYATPKTDAVLDEDKIIEAYPLNMKAENIRIVPVDEMFQK